MAEIDLTQREVVIAPKLPGQKFVFKGGEKMSSAKLGRSGQTSAVQVAGEWVDPVPPPPASKPLAYATSIAAGSTLKGNVEWLATVTAGVATSFDFLVDGVVHWTELEAPWGGTFDTTKLTNGQHSLTVIGYDALGQSMFAVGVTIDNAVVVPPVPPVPPGPEPTGKTVTLSNSDGQGSYLQVLKDMTVDLCRFVAEPYRWDKINVDVDRTARPLTTRGVPGTKFVGAGVSSEGVFFLGLNKVAKWLTFEDFAVDGVLLAQAGVFEVRATEHCIVRRIPMTNLRRDRDRSDKAGKTWGMYLSGSGSGGAGNKHFLAEDVSVSPNLYRDVGAIQMDSFPGQSDDIVLRRIKADRCDFAGYFATPVTGLVLETWDVNDSANIGGNAIRFGPTKISGRYSGIKLLNGSGKLANGSTGTMVNGGGNVGV